MNDWLGNLPYDPFPHMMASHDTALFSVVQRDLIGGRRKSIKYLLEIPEFVRITKKQTTDGCWKYPTSGSLRQPNINYNLLETFRSLSILVSKTVSQEKILQSKKRQNSISTASIWRKMSGESSATNMCPIIMRWF